MSTKPQTAGDSRRPLDRLVRQLMEEAHDRKRRVQTRLRELRGDWKSAPIRGPILPNGRPSPQWTIYQNAVRNHKRATAELAALLRLLPNDAAQWRAGSDARLQTETQSARPL